MSEYPDFSRYGYSIKAELGRNRAGGRITWKAESIQTKKTVVLKQFCFAQAGSSWSGYKAYAREIEILSKLCHPNIPQYFGSIETDDGFCLIQEYLTATPCRDRSLTLAEVKQVAEQSLDILVYLQQQHHPILHRDLSTENILLDESLNVYLVDFGLASLADREASSSSIFQGTPGFIAPEQIVNPSTASDVYSLGVSLVCLLTQKNITEVLDAALADDPYQLDLSCLLPDLEPEFKNWLGKMISSKVSQRFPDAKSAQQALQKIDSALDWQENNSSALAVDRPMARIDLKPKIVGGIAIASATTIATWSVGFAASRVELSFITTAIAIVATIAIAVTQLGTASIVSSDEETKVQGLVLNLIIPTVVVGASGSIWGIDEAIIIAAAIAITETLLLAYFWRQLFADNGSSLTPSSLLLSAIAIGITLGCQLI